MNDLVVPDPGRLAAARDLARGHLERKRFWTRALFVLAALAEAGLFGAMLFFFDFGDRFYWFVFLGLTFVYSPLITFIFRNSVMTDRLYYRLLLELRDQGCRESDGELGRSEGEARSFLARRTRWGKALVVVAGLFEVGLWVALLSFMDFASQLDWFLFLGFMAVYTPLIILAWRNAVALDRVYYSLIDELKYGGR